MIYKKIDTLQLGMYSNINHNAFIKKTQYWYITDNWIYLYDY